jgi:hypothetical protein
MLSHQFTALTPQKGKVSMAETQVFTTGTQVSKMETEVFMMATQVSTPETEVFTVGTQVLKM